VAYIIHNINGSRVCLQYTKTTLKKIEELFKEIEYTIRYEKGSFQSGYCLVENRKIAVVNRFFDTEARINCLLEILGSIEVDPTSLSDKSAAFYKKINSTLTAPNPEADEVANEALKTE